MTNSACSSDIVEKVRKVTCCQKDTTKSLAKSKKVTLLNTLKNLKPKYNPKELKNDDDCTTEYYTNKFMDSKKDNHLEERKSLYCHNERTKMSLANIGKVPYKERPFYNRRTGVCDRTDESSRSSNKMHCKCYDHSQGKHYSGRYFEKFPYSTEVTTLEAMSSCSSLDASPFEMKKEKLKPLFSKHKKKPCKTRTNKKFTNLSCESLVNHSPESDIDSSNNDRKKKHNFQKNVLENLRYHQYSPKSSYSESGKKFEVSNNHKKMFDNEENRNCSDKDFKQLSSPETYDCCCGDEKRVKAGCSYYCRCSDYREDTDSSENSFEFESMYKDCPKIRKEDEEQNYTEGERGGDEKSKECHDNEDESTSSSEEDEHFSQNRIKKSSKIKLSDLTPDIPLPIHWNQCGQHITKVADEYRHLSNKFKSMHSLAEDPCPKKSIRKKFTRTYPSGKEFTFEVKPAPDAVEQKSKEESRCECKECPLLKNFMNMKIWGNSKRSRILDSYNNLTNSSNLKSLNDSKKMNNNNLVKCPLRKETDAGHSQDINLCKETFVFCPGEKPMNQKIKSNQKLLSYAKIPGKKDKHLTKNNQDRCNCERRMFTDKMLNDKMLKDKMLNDKMLKDKMTKDLMFKSKKDQELSSVNFPRIVKPRGGSCKVNLKKILIYPPHGEEGPPLTLYKKFSNIDCRIKGDATKGFRYKVTYKQQFISPVWYSQNSGSPFRKKENTTDYG